MFRTAPEALEERRFSEKTDVWACGVLFYEIFTRAETPYASWSNQRVWVEVCLLLVVVVLQRGSCALVYRRVLAIGCRVWMGVLRLCMS